MNGGLFMQSKLNLFDLLENKKFKFRVTYKPLDLRVGTRFKIDFYLEKDFMNDASCLNVNGTEFDILYDISKGEITYKDLIEDNMKEMMDLIPFEQEVDEYKVFLAMINPILLLSMMNEHDVIVELLNDDCTTLMFPYFKLEVDVLKDRS